MTPDFRQILCLFALFGLRLDESCYSAIILTHVNCCSESFDEAHHSQPLLDVAFLQRGLSRSDL